jgi:hypothetical protein
MTRLVLQSIRMNVAVNILLDMVNNFVSQLGYCPN